MIIYRLEIRPLAMIHVEHIKAATALIKKGWHEQIADRLAETFGGEQTIIAMHLRMLAPAIFQLLPLASADSTKAAVNGGSISRFGMYAPPTAGQRANVIADRIESHNSSPIWQRETQAELVL